MCNHDGYQHTAPNEANSVIIKKSLKNQIVIEFVTVHLNAKVSHFILLSTLVNFRKFFTAIFDGVVLKKLTGGIRLVFSVTFEMQVGV